MSGINQIYRCNRCGNIVEVVHFGGGTLVCCDENMEKVDENTTDAAVEKHVPVVERDGAALNVAVGSTLHPMADAHFIEWIEVIAGGEVQRQHLNPGQEPKASFTVAGDSFTVRAYCNLHGLWKA